MDQHVERHLLQDRARLAQVNTTKLPGPPPWEAAPPWRCSELSMNVETTSLDVNGSRPTTTPLRRFTVSVTPSSVRTRPAWGGRSARARAQSPTAGPRQSARGPMPGGQRVAVQGFGGQSSRWRQSNLAAGARRRSAGGSSCRRRPGAPLAALPECRQGNATIATTRITAKNRDSCAGHPDFSLVQPSLYSPMVLHASGLSWRPPSSLRPCAPGPGQGRRPARANAQAPRPPLQGGGGRGRAGHGAWTREA